jgi:hypothetical protein
MVRSGIEGWDMKEWNYLHALHGTAVCAGDAFGERKERKITTKRHEY